MAVVALFGPTAIGKTDIAVAIAQLLRGDGREPVAVSCDALQVYEGLDLITNKPSATQLEALEHRLISFVPINQEFNAFLYAEKAHAEIDRLLEEGKQPILVGGTGLYLRAATAKMDMKPAADSAESQLWSGKTIHPTVLVGLDMERGQLYERIDARAVKIVSQEAAAEVRRALDGGASKTASKAIGFKCLAEGMDRSEAVDLVQRKTRQYAKRQLTWMRKIPAIEVFDVTDKEVAAVAHEIFAYIKPRL